MSKNKMFRGLVCLTMVTIAVGVGSYVYAAQRITDASIDKEKTQSIRLQLDAATGVLTEIHTVKKKRNQRKRIIISQNQEKKVVRRRVDQLTYENRLKKEVNEWALGLAAGKMIGTPVRMASELSTVVDDGKNLHVIPMVTRGASSNVHALLYMRGVDLAIINSDTLAHYKAQNNIPNLANRINYITQLYLSELHVIARPGIKSLDDLNGKAVNFNTKGSAGAFSGPVIFKRLGIETKKSFMPNAIALQKMQNGGNIDAVVFLSGKPVNFLRNNRWPKGFRLIPVRYNSKLTDFYLPTSLNGKDYPGLIPDGDSVPTVAVPTLLAVYNWKNTSKRYLKVERFIQYMLKRWKTFQKPPFHAKWRTINLNAKIPGWKRFPAMQEQLDLMARLNRAQALRNKPESRQISDKKLRVAFDRFLRNYARANGLNSFTKEQRDKLFLQFHKFWKETGR